MSKGLIFAEHMHMDHANYILYQFLRCNTLPLNFKSIKCTVEEAHFINVHLYKPKTLYQEHVIEQQAQYKKRVHNNITHTNYN